MDVIVKESQLLSVINNIIVSHYGQELVMKVDDDGYIRFYIPGVVDEDGDEIMLFHRNSWGMLWVVDMELVKKIRGILAFDKDEIKEYLIKYFQTKYGIVIKDVSIYFNDSE